MIDQKNKGQINLWTKQEMCSSVSKIYLNQYLTTLKDTKNTTALGFFQVESPDKFIFKKNGNTQSL